MKYLNQLIKKNSKQIKGVMAMGIITANIIASNPLFANNYINETQPLNQKDIATQIANQENQGYNIPHFQTAEKAINEISEHNDNMVDIFYSTISQFNQDNDDNVISSVYDEKTEDIHMLRHKDQSFSEDTFLFTLIHEYMHSQTVHMDSLNFKHANSEGLTKDEYAAKYVTPYNEGTVQNKRQEIAIEESIHYASYKKEVYADALTIMIMAKMAADAPENADYYKDIIQETMIDMRYALIHDTLHSQGDDVNKVFNDFFNENSLEQLKDKSYGQVFDEGVTALDNGQYIMNTDEFHDVYYASKGATLSPRILENNQQKELMEEMVSNMFEKVASASSEHMGYENIQYGFNTYINKTKFNSPETLKIQDILASNDEYSNMFNNRRQLLSNFQDAIEANDTIKKEIGYTEYDGSTDISKEIVSEMRDNTLGKTANSFLAKYNISINLEGNQILSQEVTDNDIASKIKKTKNKTVEQPSLGLKARLVQKIEERKTYIQKSKQQPT